MNNKKVCCHCHQILPLTAFSKNKQNPDGLRYNCKKCQAFYHIKRTYGLSKNDYLSMLNEQNNGCKICGVSDVKLVVDHNHKTGKVRGLLCHNCNVAIGKLQESPELFFRALQYIKGELNE